MTKSQFEKRRDKDIVQEVQEKIQEIRNTPEPTYTQVGLDVFSPDGGATFEVAEISYDPVSKQAKVDNLYKISRLIALTYANQKTALNTLKRKLPKKDGE